MTWYEFFKSVHVFAAVIWVGGALIVQFFAVRALAAPDRRRQAEFANDAEWVGMRVFLPASIILFLAAIGVMENGDWPWGQNWVVYALIVIALSVVVGAGFLGPESGRLAALIDAKGPEAPEVTARIRRILAVSRVELTFLFGVVWAMVTKPSGDAAWFWGALVVTAVVAIAAAALTVRGARDVGKPVTATN